jgi:heptosyltransferase-2
MKKVLVIQQKMIGDVLTATVLCEILKKEDFEVHYLINTNTIPVVENNPFIDKIIEFSSEINSNKRKFFDLIKKIRKQKYDIVIDAYGKIGSTLICYFSGAKTTIGYHKKHTAFFYKNTIKRIKKPQHNTSLAIENRLRLLEPLGIPFSNIMPKIYVTEKEQLEAKQFLTTNKICFNHPLFMISILGSHPNKTYPASYMAEILNYIIQQKPNAQLLFNYIPYQQEKAKEIYNKCTEATKSRIFFNVYGKNLRQFLAITSYCDALIGNEGGAVNMAKALQIPTFILFNPALNKVNWFGGNEQDKHQAVHLKDFIDYDIMTAKKNIKELYKKFKPTFVFPALKEFLNNL